MSQGAPAEKLVVGFPTYARTFTLYQPATPDIGLSIASGGTIGEWTRKHGVLSYYEVCNEINKGGSSTKRYKEQGDIVVTYKGTQWFGYDDPTTMITMVTPLDSLSNVP